LTRSIIYSSVYKSLGRELLLTGLRNNESHDNFAKVNKFEELFVEM